MSEDFLSRWSRRKRETAVKPNPLDDSGRAVDGERRAIESNQSTDSNRSIVDASAAPAELPFDITSLPPIESITAGTDLKPFLAPGVPADIARAALRRAWTADPAIRDFVGLAENDWDFHKPGSMAGFGPLEMTDELRQMVARIVGEGVARVASQVSESRSDRAPAAQELPAASTAADPDRNITRVECVNSQSAASSSHYPVVSASKHTADQQEPLERETCPSIVRRNHGRALPK